MGNERYAMIAEIMDKMAQMTHEEQEEVVVVLQILKGDAPANHEAASRVKRKVMEWQKKGHSVDDTLIRYFAG